MQALIIEKQEDTPAVTFDKDKGFFEIEGRSLPEDIVSFYTPIYDWLQEYISDPNEETIVKMKIDYFNSASQKAINTLLEILAELKLMGKKIIINWHYLDDDEELLEAGTDYAELTGINFTFVSYSS